mmetsp:Transcript_16659/g.38563  ORF Transcript_16659/g.38563 Transcript_16659/m.38563 type:complete len:115 (+) Transcript_16659:1032-1376(+)
MGPDGNLRMVDAQDGVFIGIYSPQARKLRLEKFHDRRRQRLLAGRAKSYAGKLLPAAGSADAAGDGAENRGCIRAERMIRYEVRKEFAVTRMRVKGRFVKKEDESLLREVIGLT